MSEEFLDGTNIIARFKQMRGKRMPKRVAARSLADPRFPDCLFHRPLQYELTDVMPTLNPAPGSTERFAAGKTYCHAHSRLARGYFLSSA
jgi:hypothetical protein